MTSIPNIGHPNDLRPQTRKFAGHDDTFVNADGVIEICRRINTPQAKAIYKAFRKRLVEIRASHPDLPAAKQRSRALLSAIEDNGWSLAITTTPGGAA